MPSVSRKKQGPPVVYSAEAHREFVTGFRRRKQQRRQQAQKLAAAKQKQERREERRQRRDFIRENRRKFLSDSDEDDVGNTESQVKSTEFEGVDGTVTAIVQPMDLAPSIDLPKKDEAENLTKDKSSKVVVAKVKDEEEPARAKSTAALKRGVVKPSKKFGKRRTSYTHLLAKGQLRKAKLRRRREARQKLS